MLLFSGSSNRELASRISSIAKIPLGEVETTVFSDGETRIRIIGSVLEKDVSVLQSAAKTPEYFYFELFFLMDALKRSGARSLTAVIPYLGYQRQDHIFRDGEAVSLDVIIKTLESLSLNKVITFDLHSIKIPELFSVPVVHLSALPVFAQKIKELKKNLDECFLVSPDLGGIRRIDLLSELLGGVSTAKIKKDRDLVTGEIKSATIEGEVKKTSFIVDDMISSGRTILAAVKLLKEKGAEQIFVFATHPVFSFKESDIFDDPVIQKVYVSDTIEIDKHKHFEKLEVLSVAKLIAKELKR